MDNAETERIEHELTEAQAAMKAADQARIRRQNAVAAARDAGLTKYRIAQVLGVGAPTVDSILRAADRESGVQQSRPPTVRSIKPPRRAAVTTEE